jgi:hypothetical protein
MGRIELRIKLDSIVKGLAGLGKLHLVEKMQASSERHKGSHIGGLNPL